MKKAYKSVDVARIVFAYIVLSVHALGYHYQGNTVYFLIEHLILRLSVPFFFITSGFFLGLKVKAKPAEKNNYIKKMVINLLIHYAFWGSVYSITGFVFDVGHEVAVQQALWKLVRNALTFNPTLMWYVGALVFSMIVLGLIKEQRTYLISIGVGVIFYLIGLLLGSYSGIFTGTVVEPLLQTYYKYFVTSSNGLFVGYVFVSIGFYIGCFIEDRVSAKTAWWQMLVGYVIVIIELYCVLKYLPPCLEGNYDYLIGGVLVAPAQFVLILKCRIPIRISTDIFRKMSACIYFSHMAVLSFVHVVFRLDYMMEYIVVMILVTVGAFIVYKWNNKYINMIT